MKQRAILDSLGTLNLDRLGDFAKAGSEGKTAGKTARSVFKPWKACANRLLTSITLFAVAASLEGAGCISSALYSVWRRRTCASGRAGFLRARHRLPTSSNRVT